MNKILAHFNAHWERTLFFLTLLALAGGAAGWQLFRQPPPQVIPPVKAMPQPPEMVPWEYRPLTFMAPELAPELPSPFLVAFDLPAPPEPPPETVPETPPEPPPPPPPPPPPRTCEVAYTGIYHSLLGKTIAYLKCNDSLTGEALANLTIDDEVAPGFRIAAIDSEAVTLNAPNGAPPVRIPWQETVTITIPVGEPSGE